MSSVRYRGEESSTAATIATVLLSAAAGFAIGMYIAQRVGGLDGVTRRMRPARNSDGMGRRFEAMAEDYEDREDVAAEPPETARASAPRSAPDPALEERVLEAFNNDPVLSERAIDIGAIGTGEIELAGWVEDDREAEHAVTIARGVPGVRGVVNELLIEEESGA